MPRPKKTKAVDRPVVYPKREARLFEAETALTEEDAKKILGWREAKDDEEHQFKDRDGKRIVCTLNLTNREFTQSNAEAIVQAVLRRTWKLNLETIIIGEYGSVLSGQHRLIGFVLACQDYRETPEVYPLWKSAPVLEVLIAFGASERDEVVNTIDTGKPRKLSSVLYRSERFRTIKPAERLPLVKAIEHALARLWKRSGEVDRDIYQDHAESVAFLGRHPKLVDSVQYLIDENLEKVQQYIRSLGYAACWMYFMATSKSDGEKYRETGKGVDLSNWDKAEEFWTKFLAGDKSFAVLHDQFVQLNNRNATHDMRACLLAKAWRLFVRGEKLHAEHLELSYIQNEYGEDILNEFVDFGGIDKGFGKEAVFDDYDPSLEEIEEVKEEIHNEKNKDK